MCRNNTTRDTKYLNLLVKKTKTDKNIIDTLKGTNLNGVAVDDVVILETQLIKSV